MTNDPGDVIPKEKNSHMQKGKGKRLLLHRLFTLHKYTKEAADIQFTKDTILTLKSQNLTDQLERQTFKL